MRTLPIFTSVSFRYFKAVWEESDYTFKNKKARIVVEKGNKIDVSVINNVFAK